jgi:hypothetical protein
MSTHTKKPRKPRPDVARIGVAIPQDVRKRGMQLAGQEKRSFSNFVTMLIANGSGWGPTWPPAQARNNQPEYAENLSMAMAR